MEHKLIKLNGREGNRPVLTIVMDGVGLAPAIESNAVFTARTPNLDRIMRDYPTVA
ncbi:MAG: hypothetical protein IKN36_04060, partial [Clostridia bacterium]|nr:hypothetical protein [Clostridia bacterium]